MTLLAAGTLALAAPAARADLYGYVDDAGRIHLANEKLDARYELFVKGETNTEFKLSTELKYLPPPAELTDHVIFRRLQKSPNVARFEGLVAEFARKNRLEPALVKAVIAVESAYEPAAVSPKGAVGLMQLIPGTAARYGVRRSTDPRENIEGGTRYLRDLIDMFNGDLRLALAGYNAGEGAVQRYGNAIPPFPETQAYVKLVMQFYEHFTGPKVEVVTRKVDTGRIRLTIPGRRNLPVDAGAAGGLLLAEDGATPNSRGPAGQ
ncbi:MAG: lytic transglycosylase domain-containing protein [Burkholderiales bacterium]|nr:lytic transglycosylase domain-containing protein [Burkholderiales bacterium]